MFCSTLDAGSVPRTDSNEVVLGNDINAALPEATSWWARIVEDTNITVADAATDMSFECSRN